MHKNEPLERGSDLRLQDSWCAARPHSQFSCVLSALSNFDFHSRANEDEPLECGDQTSCVLSVLPNFDFCLRANEDEPLERGNQASCTLNALSELKSMMASLQVAQNSHGTII